MKYERTRKAAETDRTSRWDLIEAIGDDAADAGIPVTGLESQALAQQACDSAGLELAAGTVMHLTVVAKFHAESTARQRRLWRTYGWSGVREIAHAGCSQEAAYEFLKDDRKTFRQITEWLRPTPTPRGATTLDERWAAWGSTYLKLMMTGAELADLSEGMNLGSASALMAGLYQRLVDRALDEELRHLLAAEAGDAR